MESGQGKELVSRAILPFVVELHNSILQDIEGNNIWELAESRKFKLKARLEDYLEDKLDDETYREFRRTLENVQIYNPVKILGPLVLTETRAKFDYIDPATGFSLKKGDPYLAIHLTPKEGSPVKQSQLKWDLMLAGQYIQRFQDRLPTHIVGITYEKLANVTRRYGFSVGQAPLPSEAKENFITHAEEYLKVFNQEVTDVRLCFAPSKDFASRFSQMV